MSTRARRFVTLEGYAVEGGFDRAGGPATCYGPTIALGRHDGAGDADDLWRGYEEVLDFVPELGFDGVRLGLEWARIEPRQGHVDDDALARYGDVIRGVRALGLGVSVTLVDAAWPAWLGLEAWLLPWVVPHVIAHARRVATLVGHEGGVVAFTRPDALVRRGYLEASAPPWRRGARRDATFARAQIASITALLAADPLVGPRLVTSSAEVSAATPGGVAASAPGVDELYVRSLVGGHGPTRAPAGLLERVNGGWRMTSAVPRARGRRAKSR